MAVERIRANSFMFAPDYHIAMFASLRDGRTVTPFVLEQSEMTVEFELVVTKINGKRVPRVAKASK